MRGGDERFAFLSMEGSRVKHPVLKQFAALYGHKPVLTDFFQALIKSSYWVGSW